MTLSKKITLSALLAGLAVLLGYIEFLIPVVPPIAGIKIGLGNIAVLLALRLCGSESLAFGVMLTKILICAALFSGMGGLSYSLAGGVSSFLVMAALCRRFPVSVGTPGSYANGGRLSAAGISAAGGAVHMAAQTAVAAWITYTVEVLSLLPLLVAVGTLTGLLNGVIVNMTERRAGGYIFRYMSGEKK